MIKLIKKTRRFCLCIAAGAVVLGAMMGCATEVRVARASPERALERQLTTRLTSSSLSSFTTDALNLVDLAGLAKQDRLAVIDELRVLADTEPRGPWRVAASELLLDQAIRTGDASLDLASAREAQQELQHALGGNGGLLGSRKEFAADLYRRAVSRFVDQSTQAWLHQDDTVVREAGGHAREVVDGKGGRFVVRMVAAQGMRRFGPGQFDELKASDFIKIGGMRNRHRVDAFGAPVVTIREQQNAQPPRAEAFFPPEGMVVPATVTLEFDDDGSVRVELWNTDRVSYIERFGLRLQLSTDITAPIAELFGRAELVRTGEHGMMNVQRYMSRIGIYMHEPYDPSKIPVLMVHGLRSTPAAWRDTLNDLRADPAIRERYQFWKFYYPSGLPIPRSAAYLRRALADVRASVDPEGTSQTMKQMVLVGHSMGGLLSKAVVQSSGDQLWASLHPEPFNEVQMTGDVREHLSEVFFYEADQHVARVVFIATPHRGSSLAASWIGRLGDSLVQLPSEFDAVDEWFRGEQSRLGKMPTHQLGQGLPSSIDDLREDSPHLLAYLEMPMREGLPFHCIAGNAAGDSDGVVPVESALLDGAASTLVVDAGHNAHTHPRAIRELRRILLEHAEQP